MTEADFYKLHIKQKVWFDGQEVTVNQISELDRRYVSFTCDDENWQHSFDDIAGQLSFDKPKDLGEEIAECLTNLLNDMPGGCPRWTGSLVKLIEQADIKRKGE